MNKNNLCQASMFYLELEVTANEEVTRDTLISLLESSNLISIHKVTIYDLKYSQYRLPHQKDAVLSTWVVGFVSEKDKKQASQLLNKDSRISKVKEIKMDIEDEDFEIMFEKQTTEEEGKEENSTAIADQIVIKEQQDLTLQRIVSETKEEIIIESAGEQLQEEHPEQENEQKENQQEVEQEEEEQQEQNQLPSEQHEVEQQDQGIQIISKDEEQQQQQQQEIEEGESNGSIENLQLDSEDEEDGTQNEEYQHVHCQEAIQEQSNQAPTKEGQIMFLMQCFKEASIQIKAINSTWKQKEETKKKDIFAKAISKPSLYIISFTFFSLYMIFA